MKLEGCEMGDSLRNFTHERCLAEPRLDPRRRRDYGGEMGGVRGKACRDVLR